MSNLRSLVLAASLWATLTPTAPAAQQSCEEVEAVVLQCARPEGISGQPPACFCEGERVENLELSCEVNFGCATSEEVGFGTWPACDCRSREEIVPPGTGPEEPQPGPNVEAGGVDVCKQFFQCPAQASMAVRSGQCVCVLEMLPAFTE